MNVVIKSQETREGVRFRILKDGKFLFANLKFNNYYYVKTKDYEIHKDDFHNTFTYCIEKCEPVGQFTKIFLSNNFLRVRTRKFWEERCNTFEADIKANKRYMLDNNLPLHNEEIPYTFYDIETDDRIPLQKDDRGNVVPTENARILSFAATDYKGEQVYFVLEEDNDESERKLLSEIIKYLSNYGIISGWHSEAFDMPYIKARCDTLGIVYQILDYINHLCYMLLFKKYDKKSRPSFSLNAISNEVLNESKVDQEKGNGAIYNTWKNNPDQLKKYNLEDSNLIYKINQKMMFIEVSMKRADKAGSHVRNTMNNSDSGDYMLMRRYKKRNIIMPSEPTFEERKQRQMMGSISGGFTRCLSPGFYDEMDVYDQKSFYPMTVATFNISPETYVETLGVEVQDGSEYPDYIITPSNWNEEKQKLSRNRVYEKADGVFKELALELVQERDKIKYTMKQYKDSDPAKYKQQYLEQYALKVDANSYFYGILGYPGSRYFSWEVADTITTGCQAIIKASYEKLEEWGCKILGGDTDSTFILLNGNSAEDIDKKLAAFYKEWTAKWNVKDNYLLMEHEKQVKPFLFCMKKNYAYKDDGEIVIKGLECIKADSAPTAAKAQRDFIEDALNYKVDMDKWEAKFDELRDMTFNQELSTSDVTLRKAISKMPSDYAGYIIDKKTGEPKVKADGTLQEKAIPAQVKLAARLLAKGKDLYPGSKIKYVVIATKPILAITPEEFEIGSGNFPHKHKKHGEYIYEWEGGYEANYYWKRLVKPLLKVIFTYQNAIPDWSFNLTPSEMKKIVKFTEEEED